MTTEEISQLRVGSYLIPNGVSLESAIMVIEIKEQGFRFRRCHLSYNGEEFFLSRDALARYQWVIVPIGTQLLLF